MSRNRPWQRVRAATVIVAAATLMATSVPQLAIASDTLPWTGEGTKGANQPYQHGYTSADLLRWTPTSDLFGDLTRARVPLQERAASLTATQADTNLDPTVQQLTLAGDYGNSFFESYPYNSEFSQYLFSYWQYTDYYAAWHGMPTSGVSEELYDPTLSWTEKWFEFGMLNLPNSGYTNAAHKNGVRSLGCIFFSNNDRGSQTYEEMLVQDADGSYPVAEKLVELANYYGFDGYFINQESAVDASDLTRYQEFMRTLNDSGLYLQWYDSIDTTTGDVSYQNAFNASNSSFVSDSTLGEVSDSIFLNYWWNKSKLTSSSEYASSIGLDSRTSVFAGVEAGSYQFDQPYDLDDNLNDAGQPMNAIATLGADFVQSDMANKTDDASQWNAFDRERLWWTGSSTGGQDDSADWKGISAYITERSAITGSVFNTTFNTGHGLEYRENGEVSNSAEWSNINIQDIPVTWQWDITAENGQTALTADYDYGPDYTKASRFSYQQIGAYEGGSSLVLSGDLAADNYVRLYSTELSVARKSRLSLTYQKVSASDDSQLRAAITFTDDPTTVVELPIRNSGAHSDDWTDATVDLSQYADRTIATIGLTVAAGATTIEDYQINLGSLTVTDSASYTPSTPRGFTLESGLAGSDEVILSWDLASYDDVAEYAVYNNGSYVGGVYDEVLYLKNFTSEKGTLELRAIGHDGSVSKAATLSYDFTSGAQNVAATSADDGSVTVTWSGVKRNTSVTVRLTSEYSDRTIVREMTTRSGSAVFEDLPTDGGNYQVSVQTGKSTAVSYNGEFVDTVAEPYSASLVTVADNTFHFATPATADWHKIYVEEDGVAKTFATTYSCGDKGYIIRGRTTSAALSVAMDRTDSEIKVIVEDYSGNTATTIIRASTATS